MHDDQCIDVKFAELFFCFCSNNSNLLFNTEGSIKYYLTSDKNAAHYNIGFSLVSSISLSHYKLVFTGEPEVNEFLNYNWYVYKFEDQLAVLVDFKDHTSIKRVVARFSSVSENVEIEIVPEKDCVFPIVIDPLIHPLGSLLMLYLVHWKQGVLIHASAVEENGSAYLFTGVSGIGKSTMARLWKECGARVLNDDRLIIRLFDDEVKLYNNPMPYYKQESGEGLLKKIFLLKQSKSNYIKPLRGIQAYSRVLGNCIQQFYHPEMVKRHLEIVEHVIDCVSVYEVGFKPDCDIVHMIRKMDND